MIRDFQISFQDLVYQSGYPQDFVKKANLSTNLIQDLFLRLLLETKEKIGGKIMKVNISLTKDEKQIKFRCFENPTDVATVFLELPFNNLDEYFELSRDNKSEFLLEKTLEAFKELSEKTDTINYSLINSIAEKCKELNYKNHYYFGKLRSSKNRKNKAGIWVEHEENTFKIYLNILDKKENLLKSELIAETLPSYPKYYPLLGGIRWIDNENVEFFNRNREVLKNLSV
ncbi:hypothetical protein EGM88_15785 [Aureibaculum marinum]|uniref:Uncharacterized protein n=1 Tax=Aureibaculum marinum TaxID=2487930 RepID=A0A3N4N345_9FLAO|nr:hypothetical protein [Aureibaculum marinum]RPD89708.1 hypothetical protein EGM88_15785 [Aureibaculum marinum]